MPDLNDVFAKIGLDRFDAFRLQRGVEPDLLRDHGLALGYGFGACVAAQLEDNLARLGGIARPMNVASGRDDLPLVFFEIDVEVIEHMVLDIDRDCAQPVELRQGGARFGALGDEPGLDIAQCALELRVAKRA